jgi:GNAT superfamily N-acetyltransferase
VKIKIRRFEKSDLRAVHQLVQNTIDVSYRGVYPEEAIEFFKEFHSPKNILKDAEAGYTVVAERDGEIVGTSTLLNDHIQRTFVNPACQRQGIGGMMAQELERQALRAKHRQLTLDGSLVSKEFWEQKGFYVVEECFVPVKNGQKLIYYKMVKDMKDGM